MLAWLHVIELELEKLSNLLSLDMSLEVIVTGRDNYLLLSLMKQ